MAYKSTTGKTTTATGKPTHWIQGATNPSTKGALHADLGVPQGQTIPLKKEQAAAHSSNPTLRHRAQFALNVRKK